MQGGRAQGTGCVISEFPSTLARWDLLMCREMTRTKAGEGGMQGVSSVIVNLVAGSRGAVERELHFGKIHLVQSVGDPGRLGWRQKLESAG